MELPAAVFTGRFDSQFVHARELFAGRVFEHRREVRSGLRVLQDTLLLRDEVAVGPVYRRLIKSVARQQALVAVVEHGGKRSPAPAIEHRMMEAQHKLEAFQRPKKDMDMKQRSSLPVQYMPPALLPPVLRIYALSLRIPAAHVFHFQRHFPQHIDLLQPPPSLQTSTRPPDRLRLYAGRQILFKPPPSPPPPPLVPNHCLAA